MTIGIIKKYTTQLHHNVVSDLGTLDINVDASVHVRTEIWTVDHINTIVGYNTSFCSMITGSGMEGTYNVAIVECKIIYLVQKSNTPILDGVYILSNAFTSTPCIYTSCRY